MMMLAKWGLIVPHVSYPGRSNAVLNRPSERAILSKYPDLRRIIESRYALDVQLYQFGLSIFEDEITCYGSALMKSRATRFAEIHRQRNTKDGCLEQCREYHNLSEPFEEPGASIEL